MNWEVAGYAALLAVGGFIASVWGQIKGFFYQIQSCFITTVVFESNALTLGVLRVFKEHGKRFNLVNPVYMTKLLYVLTKGKFQHVVGETPVSNTLLYWYKGGPYWVSYSSTDRITVYGLRWLFKPDQLALEAREQHEAIRQGWLEQTDQHQNHFYVEHFYGEHRTFKNNPMSAMGKKNKKGGDEQSLTMSFDFDELCTEDFIHVARILEHNPGDLATSSRPSGSMDQLILTSSQKDLIKEFDKWRNGQEWYASRNIPWRRGWLFEGPPGTGKSVFSRSLAEYGNIPLLVFDLSSMNNAEFHEAFAKLAFLLPAVLLFEDFDTVFKNRENCCGSDLTFDCVINHLDGVDQYAGLFLIITTNEADTISSAIIDRPGRVDRRIFFGPFMLRERLQMAHRILPEYPEEAERLARESEDVPAVVFQERCFQEAQRIFWEEEVQNECAA